jgi:alpha-2-macroglobulin
MTSRLPRARRPLFRPCVVASWLLLACHPAPTTLQSGVEDLVPEPVPLAPVVATLGPDASTMAQPAQAALVPPRLEAYGQLGPESSPRAAYLEFSEPMLEGQGTPQTTLEMTIQPAVEGSLVWRTPHRLELAFEDEPAKATRYEVHATGTVVSTVGEPLAVDLHWSFETGRSTVTLQALHESGSWRYRGFDGDNDATHFETPFGIRVSDRVTLGRLRKHVHVTARPRDEAKAVAVAVPFSLRRATKRERARHWWLDEDCFVVTPRKHWPSDSVVEVLVDAQLRTTGPLPIGRDAKDEIVTERGVRARVECARTYEDGCDPGPLTVHFSRNVPRRAVRSVSVEPRPEKLDIFMQEAQGSSIEIQGRFEPGQSYRVRVDGRVRDVFGQPLEAAIDRTLDFVPPPPALSLSSTRGTLAANGVRTIGIESRWLKTIRIRAAVLEDQDVLDQISRDDVAFAIPSKALRVHDELLELSHDGDLGWSSHVVDLAALTGGRRLPVAVEVTPVAFMPEADGRPLPKTVRGLYQQTDLGLVAVVSPSRSIAHVSALSSARPLEDIVVELYRGTRSSSAPKVAALGRTDATGMVDLLRSAALPKRGLLMVRTKENDDRFVVRVGEARSGFPERRRTFKADAYIDDDRLLSEITTERPLYRPGETVRVVGWTALSTNRNAAGLAPVPPGTEVEIRLIDRDNEEAASRTVRVKPYGKYWATLPIPDEARLGNWRLQAKLLGRTFEQSIRVKDFRTPTFEVVSVADQGDVVGGQSVTVGVAASYFFGGEVPITHLRRHTACRRHRHRPTGLASDWIVAESDGDGLPWSRTLSDADASQPSADEKASGRARVVTSTASLEPEVPWRCTLGVAVGDVSGEEVGTEAQWFVHPPSYLALRRPGRGHNVGDSLEIAVRAIDFSGARRAGEAILVEVERSWVEPTGKQRRREQKVTTCRLQSKHSGPESVCRLHALARGYYRVRAWMPKVAGKPETHTSFWVGESYQGQPTTGVSRLEVDVSPRTPIPGETATIRVRAPNKRGRGLVILAHGGIRDALPFSLVDGEATIPVQVDQSWVPGLEVEALLPLASSATGNLGRPTLARARVRTVVEEHRRDLSVALSAPAEAGPNEGISIDVAVTDARGNPTAAHVALWAVDEAVLSLEDPELPRLVERFIIDRRPAVSIEDDYGTIVSAYHQRADPYRFGWVFGRGGTGYGSGGGGGSVSGYGKGGSIGVMSTPVARQRFETTPIFVGDVAIGASGKGVVKGRMPENLSTFRITAIASAGLDGDTHIGRFGVGEARTRVFVPLALRVVAPRGLRPGDRAEVAAVIDNLGGPAGSLDVELRLHDAKGIASVEGRRRATARIEAGGQVRLPFMIRTDAAGNPDVEMRVALTPDDRTRTALQDAMRIELPVVVERTLTRRVATYGTLTADDPIAIELDVPEDRVDRSGNVSVHVDTSLLDGLQDVAESLVRYPYGCVEQTSSTLVPLLALGELAHRYEIGIDSVDHHLEIGIARLQAMQTQSGGFGYWPGAARPHLYGTAYASWVLEQMRQAGHHVPTSLQRQAQIYLRNELRRWVDRDTTSAFEDIPVVMALHALSHARLAPPEAVDRLWEVRMRLPDFARAMLLMTLHELYPDDDRVAQLMTEIVKQIARVGPVASVKPSHRWYHAYFDSDARTHAMILLALMQVEPDHEATIPLARGMLNLRAAGRLRNTQESAYALLALAAYSRHYEAEIPSLRADAWVGREQVLSRRFEGHAFVDASAVRPVPSSIAEPPRVTVRRQGTGRLYYRVGMQWTPRDPITEPIAEGITVSTVLRDARGEIDDGASIPLGTLLALDVTVEAKARLDYVAVDVPLPGGLEAIDSSIGRGRRAMTLGGSRGSWVSHEEVRRDRAVLFADSLRAGPGTHTVYLRATAAGTYQMPPTVAQSMYYPELQGTTTARTIEVAAVRQ